MDQVHAPLAAGTVFVALAVVIVVRPRSATRFVESFASSAKAHYTEQAARLLAGAALLVFAPSMWFSRCFEVLGWLLTVTSIVLCLVPWRWHHRFGQWAIPLVVRHLRLYGLGAAMLGAFILYGAPRALAA